MVIYQIVLVPKNSGATACTYFPSKELADIAMKNIHDMQRKEDGVIVVKDSYGFELSMDVKNLSYALMIDVKKSHELHGAPAPKSPILNS